MIAIPYSRHTVETIRELSSRIPAKEVDGNIFTGPVRLSFPSLFEPAQIPGQPGAGRYSVTGLYMPGTEDQWRFLGAKTAALKSSEFPGVSADALRSPLRDQAEKSDKYTGYIPKCPFFVSRSKYAPGVYDSALRKVASEHSDKVYPGVWANLKISLYAYNKVQRGIGCNLLAVMLLLDDDPYLDGSSESNEEGFEAIDLKGQGWAASSSPPLQTADEYDDVPF